MPVSQRVEFRYTTLVESSNIDVNAIRIFYIQDGNNCMLHKYSVNGKLLAFVSVDAMSDMTVSGQWLVGAHGKKLIVRSLEA